MASYDSSSKNTSKNDIPTQTADNRKQSQCSSTEQSSDTIPEPPAVPQKRPPVDPSEKIEARSDPSSPRQNPQSPRTPSTENCASAAAKSDEGEAACTVGRGVALLVGITVMTTTLWFNSKMVEGYFVSLSFLCYPIITLFLERGACAKQPPMEIEESKRNRYEDIPSLDGGFPLEPPCPRPRVAAPKEIVYQADVHHVDLSSSVSTPSSSSEAKAADPKEGSKTPSSTPSTIGLASVDVHVSSQGTEDKEGSSGKDS